MVWQSRFFFTVKVIKFATSVTFETFCTTPTQKCLDTYGREENFTAVREVLCNSYDLAISPHFGNKYKKVILLTRLFLRLMLGMFFKLC